MYVCPSEAEDKQLSLSIGVTDEQLSLSIGVTDEQTNSKIRVTALLKSIQSCIYVLQFLESKIRRTDNIKKEKV